MTMISTYELSKWPWSLHHYPHIWVGAVGLLDVIEKLLNHLRLGDGGNNA